MNRLPETFSTERLASARVFTITGKSWLGRLALAVVGVAAMVLTVVLSVVFVVFALLAVVGGVFYLRWHARRLRKAMQPAVIEGEVRDRHID